VSLPCLTGCRKWRLNGHARRIDERRFPHGGAPPSRKEAGWHPRAAQSSHVTDGCGGATSFGGASPVGGAFSEL